MNVAIKVAGAIVAVLVSALPAQAAAATAPTGFVLSSFELDGSNGYEIEGGTLQEGDFPPTAEIVVHRDRTRAAYQVPAELQPGLQAHFGSLGGFALRFHRRQRTVDRPERGCVWIEETGVFRGQVSFTGEAGYTTVTATSAPGEVVRLPYGFCGFGGDRRNPAEPEFPYSIAVGAGTRIPGGTVRFEASRLGGSSPIEFGAEVTEAVGAMKITRTAFVIGSSERLSVGGGKHPRQVRVEPPAPFEGSAEFRRIRGGGSAWTGSLQASLPGAPNTRLAGPGFDAKLCPRLGILGKCKVGRVTSPPGHVR